jgi:hypothetical protein
MRSLRRPDVTDPCEQLVKVVAAAAAFEALVVEREALDQVLAEPLSRPDPELSAPVRLHPVADRDDHIQVEVLDLVRLPVGGSCCRFCNNCPAVQFALVEHVRDVSRDDRLIVLKQFGHLTEG